MISKREVAIDTTAAAAEYLMMQIIMQIIIIIITGFFTATFYFGREKRNHIQGLKNTFESGIADLKLRQKCRCGLGDINSVCVNEEMDYHHAYVEDDDDDNDDDDDRRNG